EQFHVEYLRQLENVSSYIDDEALLAKFRAAYNWKLNFENVNDYNHVPFVHSKTFAPLVTRAFTAAEATASIPEPISDDEIDANLPDLSYASEAPFDFPHWPWHDWVERYGKPDFYYNFFIYPDINFITMGGAIYLVQQFTPIGPAETEVTLTMTTGRKRQRIP